MSIQNQSAARYAFEQGMKNIAFLTGFARVRQENGETRYYLQQDNDMNTWLPIHEDQRGQVRRHFVDRQPVKVYGRVRGRIVEIDGVKHREAFILPMAITATTVLEMPSALSWNSVIKNRQPDPEHDEFQPFNRSERDLRLQDTANNVEIAGIVNAISAIRNEDDGKIDGVEIEVRQHADIQSTIPVRVMNSGIASVLVRQLMMGSPVLVTGKYNVRSLKKTSEDGVVTDSDQRIGYIWCRNLHNARQDVDIKQIPAWIKDILDRYGITGSTGAPAQTGTAGATGAPHTAMAEPASSAEAEQDDEDSSMTEAEILAAIGQA